MVVLFGGFYAGATIALLSPALPADQLEHQLRDSGAKTVFFQGSLAPKVLPVALTAGIDEDNLFALDNQARDGLRNWTELRDGGDIPVAERPPRPVINPETDAAVIVYTSATNNSVPAGCVSSHRNMLAVSSQLYECDREHRKQVRKTSRWMVSWDGVARCGPSEWVLTAGSGSCIFP